MKGKKKINRTSYTKNLSFFQYFQAHFEVMQNACTVTVHGAENVTFCLRSITLNT